MTVNAMPDPVESLRGSAALIVRELWGVSPTEVRHLPAGHLTTKFIVESGSDRVVVRFYPETRRFIVNFEPDLLRGLAAIGAKVPVVIADSRTGPVGPQPYLVYRWMDGETLESKMSQLRRDTLSSIAGEVLAFLQQMSGLHVSGWGDLCAAAVAKHPSEKSFIGTSIKSGIKAAGRNRALPLSQIQSMERVLSRLDHLPLEQPPGIAWADVSTDHILLDANHRVTGFLDFEGSLSGPAALNIGYAQARYAGTPFFDALAQHWRRSNSWDDSLVDVYSVVRAARLLPYFETTLPSGKARQPINQFLGGLGPALLRAQLQGQK